MHMEMQASDLYPSILSSCFLSATSYNVFRTYTPLPLKGQVDTIVYLTDLETHLRTRGFALGSELNLWPVSDVLVVPNLFIWVSLSIIAFYMRCLTRPNASWLYLSWVVLWAFFLTKASTVGNTLLSWFEQLDDSAWVLDKLNRSQKDTCNTPLCMNPPRSAHRRLQRPLIVHLVNATSRYI